MQDNVTCSVNLVHPTIELLIVHLKLKHSNITWSILSSSLIGLYCAGHLSNSANIPLTKANCLIIFFSSCFSPLSPATFTTLPNPLPPNCSISSISYSEEEVNHLLSTYKLKTASGPDSISSTILHHTSSSISPALTSLPQIRKASY